MMVNNSNIIFFALLIVTTKCVNELWLKPNQNYVEFKHNQLLLYGTQVICVPHVVLNLAIGLDVIIQAIYF